MSALFDHPILTVRIHAGFNANAFLGGLLALTGQTSGTASAFLNLRFPRIKAEIRLEERFVNDIAGWTCRIHTPHEHAHRTPGDILRFYEESTLSADAKVKAEAVWRVLSQAEASVHGASPDQVHFHEVGRLANILAVGLIADFMTTIEPSALVASPLPLTDGSVRCAHGTVPYPAPSMFAMMKGLPVRPWDGEGEPVTPTGLAVLLGLGARFGGWPKMRITERVTVFTPQVFEGVPNGTLFAMGTPWEKENDE
ncbi:MAG: nickel insertion protein [Sutterella sp.]